MIITAGLGMESHFVLARKDSNAVSGISSTHYYVQGGYFPDKFTVGSSHFVQVAQTVSSEFWMVGPFLDHSENTVHMVERANPIAISMTQESSDSSITTNITLFYTEYDLAEEGTLLYKEQISGYFQTRSIDKVSIGDN